MGWEGVRLVLSYDGYLRYVTYYYLVSGIHHSRCDLSLVAVVVISDVGSSRRSRYLSTCPWQFH